MRHLIESFTCTVDRSLLSLNLVQASRVNRNALDLHVMRIRRRIRPLGFEDSDGVGAWLCFIAHSG